MIAPNTTSVYRAMPFSPRVQKICHGTRRSPSALKTEPIAPQLNSSNRLWPNTNENKNTWPKTLASFTLICDFDNLKTFFPNTDNEVWIIKLNNSMTFAVSTNKFELPFSLSSVDMDSAYILAIHSLFRKLIQLIGIFKCVQRWLLCREVSYWLRWSAPEIKFT